MMLQRAWKLIIRVPVRKVASRPLAGSVGDWSWMPTRSDGRIVGMPPIRRILVLAVEGAQSLDVLGPVEIFDTADRLAPGSYEIELVGPADDGFVTLSNGVRLGVAPL